MQQARSANWLVRAMTIIAIAGLAGAAWGLLTDRSPSEMANHIHESILHYGSTEEADAGEMEDGGSPQATDGGTASDQQYPPRTWNQAILIKVASQDDPNGAFAQPLHVLGMYHDPSQTAGKELQPLPGYPSLFPLDDLWPVGTTPGDALWVDGNTPRYAVKCSLQGPAGVPIKNSGYCEGYSLTFVEQIVGFAPDQRIGWWCGQGEDPKDEHFCGRKVYLISPP